MSELMSMKNIGKEMANGEWIIFLDSETILSSSLSCTFVYVRRGDP